ncbi:hypothetical protein MNBD_GAMMA16-744 [hydrothermal vent metagenome]|uniref:Type II secretion system protein GspB C-terminal domain-containing protein n=1 Tax=hydrothermal vent metagenome TaxID=652676 RepID=A0A3B0ZCZ7_9ZZZZ
MSYILDALKKSEKERNLGKVPTLAELGQPSLPPSSSNATGRVKEIIIGVLVLVVIIGAYFFVTKNKTEVLSADADVARPIEQQESKVQTRKIPQSDIQIKTALPQEQDILAIRDNSFKVPEKNTKVESTEIKISQQEAHKISKKEERDEDRRPEFAEEPELDIVPLLSEVQANPLMGGALMTLPELSLDVHVYGDSSNERFVFINMRKYREGNITDEGLSVDSIDIKGVILSIDGEQFRLPINK